MRQGSRAWGLGATVPGVICKGLHDKVTFEQRLEESERVN